MTALLTDLPGLVLSQIHNFLTPHESQLVTLAFKTDDHIQAHFQDHFIYFNSTQGRISTTKTITSIDLTKRETEMRSARMSRNVLEVNLENLHHTPARS